VSDLLSTDINDFCFIDTETKALPHTAGTVDEDVTLCGSYRYAEGARCIMVQYAVGNQYPSVIAVPTFDGGRTIQLSDLPQELIDFHDSAQRGERWFAGWHMAFDRLLLSTIEGFTVRPDMAIDVACQAAASNLPPELNFASVVLGRHGKQDDGKELIKLFTTADWTASTPQTHPEEWRRFMSYGGRDIDETRGVYKMTRPLSRREWEEYWANERINDRGMLIDVDFAKRCAAIAEANKFRLNRQLSHLTRHEPDPKVRITAATQRERIANWLWKYTHNTDARNALVKTWAEEDNVAGEIAEEMKPAKLSVAEDRLNTYIAVLETLDEEKGLTDEEADLLDIAEARRTGASATPAKFQKALDYATSDDRLKGQFRFNGAQQTGRFSSTGVQVHNLVRASLTDTEHPDRELDLIEFINELTLEE
jgi:DNA polymerase